MGFGPNWPSKSAEQVLSEILATTGLVAGGFALGYAWISLDPEEVRQIVILTITPLALSPIFFRARDKAS